MEKRNWLALLLTLAAAPFLEDAFCFISWDWFTKEGFLESYDTRRKPQALGHVREFPVVDTVGKFHDAVLTHSSGIMDSSWSNLSQRENN